jgi:tetratricopeptide (TPR) repeat protein
MTATEGPKDEREGNNDYWRALAARAMKDTELARKLLARALERNDQHLLARSQLASIYYAEGNYQQALALFEAGDITKINEAESVRRLVSSMEKTGQLQRAISTAEEALKRVEPTAGLYEELATLYEKAGEASRARQTREEARKLAEKRPGS